MLLASGVVWVAKLNFFRSLRWIQLRLPARWMSLPKYRCRTAPAITLQLAADAGVRRPGELAHGRANLRHASAPNPPGQHRPGVTP